MRKLKSSFKSFQEAITSIKPMNPICTQESRTHSFRDDDHNSNTNCIYSTPSTSSSYGLSKPIHFTHKHTNLEENLHNHDSTNTPMTHERFFFSPSSTKYIMEECKKLEVEAVAANAELSFFKESVITAMASDDPYQDFRESMKEMVEAHRLKEWPQLEELLHCYLSLNEKETHKIIILAFVDLLMHIMSRDKEGFSASFPLPRHGSFGQYDEC